MNASEAIERASQEKTLVDALSWIAIWECERAIKQAIECERTGQSTASHGGKWDTCFGVLFQGVVEKHADRICPAGHMLFPLSRHEAEVMNCVSERFLKDGSFATPNAG